MSRLTLFYTIVLVATYVVCNDPFFWDTVQLASKHGHFFYSTDFKSLILPEEIDSGHPPMFGIYIALIWKLFGKTLAASHFSMLPFLFGIVFFLNKIGIKILGERRAPWLLLICFADPVLAGQTVLISPDIALASFFLMALWAIWSNKNWGIVLSIIGLGLISTRGMMLGFALYAFAVFIAEDKIDLRLLVGKALPFIPGGVVAGGYLYYHWSQTGWIGYHANSTWAPSFEHVDLQGFIKNNGVLIWRLLDFGRVFIWMVLAWFAFLTLNKSKWKLPKIERNRIGWQIFALVVFVFLAVGPMQLFYKGLLAHRYFLPFFLSLNFLVLHLACYQIDLVSKKQAWYKTIPIVLCIGLATGNFWVYPQKIATGWDSTLAHLPWYGLLKQVETFVKGADIPYETIGTGFPNIGSREIYELNGKTEGFVEKDLNANCYLLYSNIMNDFSDEEIDELQTRWKALFRQEVGGVCAILYKNPNQAFCEN